MKLAGLITEPVKLRNITVLYVGGDKENIAVLHRVLDPQGARIYSTTDTNKTIRAVKDQSPDFIVLEAAWAGSNGSNICSLLRSDPDVAPVPILFFIPSPDLSAEMKCIRSGADGFLSKPVNPGLLGAYIENLLRRHSSQVKNYRLLRSLEKYISSRAKEKAEQQNPEKITATILFTDMRGFTETTRTRKIEDVFTSISDIHRQQIAAIHRHGGYVDKFTGDGLLAAFDASPHHVRDACLAALTIRQMLKSQNDRKLWEIPPIGMGIHSGPLLRGNIGGPEHMDFSVIGTTVNIAARLCGQANPLEVIVTEAVKAKTGRYFLFGRGKTVMLKGIGDIKIYRLENNSKSLTKMKGPQEITPHYQEQNPFLYTEKHRH